MIYVVLGMHKSGTTLVARTLHESGIIMGQEFSPSANYSDSKYEAKWPQLINDEILGASRDLLSLHVTSNLLPNGAISKDIQNRMSEGIAKMDTAYENWGFKDPRAALTYQYWKEVLPPHKVIVIYRNPVEVWRRYSKVNRRWFSRLAFEVWADYNNNILESLPEDNVLFLEFEGLLSHDKEMKKLKLFTDTDLIDIRDPSQSQFSVSDRQRKSLSYKVLNLVAGEEVHSIYARLESLRGE